MSRNNMIFAGMWLSCKKPSMNTFLKPFFDAFPELARGLRMYSPDEGEFEFKALILACTADLFARSMLANMMQYNGDYSSIKCFHTEHTNASRS